MEIAWIVLGSVVSLAAVNFFTHLAEVICRICAHVSPRRSAEADCFCAATAGDATQGSKTSARATEGIDFIRLRL
jgi:hypothetical protein